MESYGGQQVPPTSKARGVCDWASGMKAAGKREAMVDRMGSRVHQQNIESGWKATVESVLPKETSHQQRKRLESEVESYDGQRVPSTSKAKRIECKVE